MLLAYGSPPDGAWKYVHLRAAVNRRLHRRLGDKTQANAPSKRHICTIQMSRKYRQGAQLIVCLSATKSGTKRKPDQYDSDSYLLAVDNCCSNWNNKNDHHLTSITRPSHESERESKDQYVFIVVRRTRVRRTGTVHHTRYRQTRA
jgi:hypothetical protein